MKHDPALSDVADGFHPQGFFPRGAHGLRIFPAGAHHRGAAQAPRPLKRNRNFFMTLLLFRFSVRPNHPQEATKPPGGLNRKLISGEFRDVSPSERGGFRGSSSFGPPWERSYSLLSYFTLNSRSFTRIRPMDWLGGM